ncbi:hypothetical protein [Desulfosoma caldarium]|uniref:Cell division protein FtsL n=1 Tax=Desulfosoma caldarium TaxID=610254 RepID=A0A3N1UXI6_9BACT|nr:hypothetical protein [Desulfosoma caldarium]ROQ93247.1 hypothetical protein EDC27_1258 [Desulfosoma caldarium]
MRIMVILLGFIGVGLAAYSMWLQTQQVNDSYRLMQLQEEYSRWFEIKRRVELEWARLQAPDHLRSLAHSRFRLREARENDQWYVLEP